MNNKTRVSIKATKPKATKVKFKDMVFGAIYWGNNQPDELFMKVDNELSIQLRYCVKWPTADFPELSSTAFYVATDVEIRASKP